MIAKLAKYQLIVFGFLIISSNLLASSFNKKEVRQALVEISEKMIKKGLQDPVLIKFIEKAHQDEFELLEICKKIERNQDLLNKKKTALLKNIKNEIKEYLRSFIATGFSSCFGPDLGFVWDTTNPTITIKFVNASHEIKTRKHQFIINSIGFKFVMSLNFCAIKITGKSFNYYDSRKELKLGSGIDLVGAPGLGLKIMYCGIKDVPGAHVFLIGMPIGIAGGTNYIYGGTISPVN